jgi:hypothetical protein
MAPDPSSLQGISQDALSLLHKAQPDDTMAVRLHSGRWYDKDPGCTRMVAQIQDIRQEEVRRFASELLLQFAERLLLRIQEQSSGPKSMGLAAIKNRYLASQYTRRWYDHDPLLKKTFGIFYRLPMEGLTALAFLLNDTLGLLGVYASVCEQLDQPPDSNDLTHITRTSLFQGPEEAASVLQQLVGLELFEALR